MIKKFTLTMEKDSLEYLPVDKWGDLQHAFKSDWPRSIAGYNTLETHRKLIEEGLDDHIKVYCPFGDVWNGMVAIMDKGPSHRYEIVIQCPGDTKNLENALNDTKIVDWTRSSTIMPFAPQHVFEMIQRIMKNFGNAEKFLVVTDSFVWNKQIPVSENISLPSEITFGLLSPSHADLIDSKWPHQYPGSVSFFQDLIKAKHGYGLFKSNELISWIFISNCGYLLHLFTLEEYRQKGYAELVLKLFCNVLRIQGKDVFGYVVKGNYKSLKLFEKLGFHNFGDAAWSIMTKNEN